MLRIELSFIGHNFGDYKNMKKYMKLKNKI